MSFYTPERLQGLIFREIPNNLSTYQIGGNIEGGSVIYSPTTRATATIVIDKGTCEVDVAGEVFIRKSGRHWWDYSRFLEDYLEEHDYSEEALDEGSNLFLTNWFSENLGSSAKRLGCKVDDVHVHGGRPGSSGEHSEHVHIKCREKLPCGLAVKGAIEALQTVEMLK